jgi:hypothetical protein
MTALLILQQGLFVYADGAIKVSQMSAAGSWHSEFSVAAKGVRGYALTNRLRLRTSRYAMSVIHATAQATWQREPMQILDAIRKSPPILGFFITH